MPQLVTTLSSTVSTDLLPKSGSTIHSPTPLEILPSRISHFQLREVVPESSRKREKTEVSSLRRLLVTGLNNSPTEQRITIFSTRLVHSMSGTVEIEMDKMLSSGMMSTTMVQDRNGPLLTLVKFKRKTRKYLMDSTRVTDSGGVDHSRL